MRRGFITSLAMNGAALVHDFEIALVGKTLPKTSKLV